MAAVRRAAVIGTGTMGPGIGAVLARTGIETALYDVSPEALERAKGGAELAAGVLERLDAAKEDGGSLRFEDLKVNVNPFYVAGGEAGAVTRASRRTVINVSAGGGSVPTFVVQGDGE